MAEELVKIVLGQLAHVAAEELKQEVRLVTGVEDEIKNLGRSFAFIQAGLIDAERREVKEEVVRIWLEELKDVSYQIGDVLDEWSTELLRIRIKHDLETRGNTCSCFSFRRAAHRRDIALQIRELNKKLDTIAGEKDKFRFNLTPDVAARQPDLHHRRELTTSFINASAVLGREEEIADLVDKLVLSPRESSSSSSSTVQIISIVGAGGMGKTTLAQRVYNDDMVKGHFEKMIWICVSDPFNQAEVVNTIFEKVGGDATKTTQIQSRLESIQESTAGKKFMLVLDDVWTEDSNDLKPLLNALQGAANGSKILVTTRKEQVARTIGSTDIHSIGSLSYEASWQLFSSIAFIRKTEEDRKSLEEVGKRITERCKGLPLAIKTIASHLGYKTTVNQWRQVLDSEVWQLQVAEKEIFPPLVLSYNDLPSAIKRCFSYCAIFPKDFEIERKTLIRLWMAQGYLNSSSCGKDFEEVGQDYLEQLIMRSFFQDFKRVKDEGEIKSFKMHDIVHDFAMFLAKSECKTVDVGEKQSTDLSGSTSSFPYQKLRHLRISNAKKSRDRTDINVDLRNLHTIVLPSGFCSRNLFGRMRFVKVLDLSRGVMYDIPKEVGALKHLRYLDLSVNLFRRLPEEICELCNLQTICLERCENLEKLPKNIGKLVNLRHLLIGDRNYSLNQLPKGIRINSSLRTLPLFIAGRSEDANAAHIEDLGGLIHLQGALTIRGLGNVRDRSKAAKAGLKNKTQLIHLTLEFDYNYHLAQIRDDSDLDVAEGLEPQPALEELSIERYGAPAIPSWIMRLSKLRVLYLSECSYLKELPPLGRLASLESLTIHKNSDLETIGGDFWGILEPRTTDSELPVVFPKLEYLSFSFFYSLKEWEGPSSSTSMVVTTTNKPLPQIDVFPCLRKLVIYSCEKLKALPSCLLTAPLLQELDIRYSPLLYERYNADSGDLWPTISHIPFPIVRVD